MSSLRSKLLGVAVAACAVASVALSAGTPLPTEKQVEWSDAAVGVFVHWSPQVYQRGELDNNSTPLSQINPDLFDARAVVAAAKSIDAGYLVFVTKHLGGFCLWPTDTTPYSIKNTPYKGGKGDMVGEMADACREGGLRFGTYLVPASRYDDIGNRNIARDPAKQPFSDKQYRDQLNEVLTKYGHIF